MGKPDLTVNIRTNFPQPVAISTDGCSTWVAPAVLETGTSFQIGFCLKNAGNETAYNVPLQLKINDVILVDKTLAQVNRGGSYWYHYGTYGLQPGEYTITLILDPYNVIQETDESNNTFSYTINAPGNRNWLIKTAS